MIFKIQAQFLETFPAELSVAMLLIACIRENLHRWAFIREIFPS